MKTIPDIKCQNSTMKLSPENGRNNNSIKNNIKMNQNNTYKDNNGLQWF